MAMTPSLNAAMRSVPTLLVPVSLLCLGSIAHPPSREADHPRSLGCRSQACMLVDRLD
jgi:hypothetical protein